MLRVKETKREKKIKTTKQCFLYLWLLGRESEISSTIICKRDFFIRIVQGSKANLVYKTLAKFSN